MLGVREAASKLRPEKPLNGRAPPPPGTERPPVVAPRGSLAHREDIQGLRAVAVLLVVLGHAGLRFFSGGFVGVDVFFVLSGFLITGLLLAEARTHGSVSLLQFYLRRARRILPAAAVTLVATDIAALYALNFVRAHEAVVDSLHAAAFGANFHFAARSTDYFAAADPPSVLLHYWSLSVEEQFYLVWPLLLSVALFGLALWRTGVPAATGRERRLLLVAVGLTGASLGWSLHLTAALPEAAYFSPFTRAWELGLGVTIAVGASTLAHVPPLARLVMGWLGIAAIGLAAGLYSAATPFPGFAALVPTGGAALVIVAGMGARSPRLAAARLLALRPMCIVGDRSYALYLWHWPILILADQYVGHGLPVSVKLVLLVGAFLLSCASYALVENPIRRRVRSRTGTGIVVAVSMAAVLGAASVSLAAGEREQRRFEATAPAALVAASFDATETSSQAPGPLPAVVAAVKAARRGEPIPSGLTPPIHLLWRIPPQYVLPSRCVGDDRDSTSTTAICRVGRASSPNLIVLLGDSHAHMWLPAILKTAWQDDWAVVPLIRLGCTPNEWTTSEGTQACRDWYRWAIREVRRLRPSLVLVGGSIPEQQTLSARRAVAGIVAAARTLRRVGRVAVIGDPEGLDFKPLDCLLSRHASMARCTVTWPATSLVAYNTIARRAKQSDVAFLATRDFVCFQRSCPAVIGRTIAWRDNSHVTGTYAAQIAPEFRAALLRAMPDADG